MNKLTTISAICLVTALLISCTESFRLVDSQDFNKRILDRRDINMAEELVILYYSDFGEMKMSNLQKSGSNTYTIVLIDEGWSDDSVAGMKVVMTAG